jgi:hypothetical protein
VKEGEDDGWETLSEDDVKWIDYLN